MKEVNKSACALHAALDVHMTNTGAFERDPVEQERDVAYLREKLRLWMPTSSLETVAVDRQRFDLSVNQLIAATLAEHDAYSRLSKENE